MNLVWRPRFTLTSVIARSLMEIGVVRAFALSAQLSAAYRRSNGGLSATPGEARDDRS